MSKQMSNPPTMATVTSSASGKKTKKTKLPKLVPKQPKFHYGDSLTGCAADYGALLADPFVKEHHACIPALPAFDSQKITVWNEGTMIVGTAGTGYVAMNPFAGQLSAGAYIGQATNAVFGGVTISPFATAGTNSLFSNSPYPTAVSGLEARVVAAGIRIWYSGPINVMGGDIVAVQEPNHGDLTGASFSQLLAYSQSRRSSPAMATRYGCVFTPINTNEFDYTKCVAALSPQLFMAVMVNGAPGTQWSYELFAHYEYQGPTVRGKTPVHIDAVGVSSVLAVAENSSASTSFSSKGVKDDANRVSAMWENMGHYALKGVSGVGHLLSIMGAPGVSTAGAVLAYGADRADSFLYDGGRSGGFMDQNPGSRM